MNKSKNTFHKKITRSQMIIRQNSFSLYVLIIVALVILFGNQLTA